MSECQITSLNELVSNLICEPVQEKEDLGYYQAGQHTTVART